jgi:hypothetical protein
MSFAVDLEYSESQVLFDYWSEIYTKAFGEHTATAITGPNSQRDGLDRVIVLPNQRQILIDEKAIRKHHTIEHEGEMQDRLWIEEYSVYEKKVLGWGLKPLRADYIAYGFPTARRCHLLPVIQLQAAFKTHGRDWFNRGWRALTALGMNDGYRTSGYKVPMNVLRKAIGEAMTIQLETLNNV